MSLTRIFLHDVSGTSQRWVPKLVAHGFLSSGEPACSREEALRACMPCFHLGIAPWGFNSGLCKGRLAEAYSVLATCPFVDLDWWLLPLNKMKCDACPRERAWIRFWFPFPMTLSFAPLFTLPTETVTLSDEAVAVLFTHKIAAPCPQAPANCQLMG